MANKANIPTPIRKSHELLSPSYMAGLNKELCTATTPTICHMCVDPGQKISKRNNANNVALTTALVIRRIKDMCGQAISVRYPDKANHDRQRMRLTANV